MKLYHKTTADLALDAYLKTTADAASANPRDGFTVGVKVCCGASMLAVFLTGWWIIAGLDEPWTGTWSNWVRLIFLGGFAICAIAYHVICLIVWLYLATSYLISRWITGNKD
jgi:hypothetical protein